MNSFVKKVVLGATITLSAVSAQAHHHHHGFWGGFTGGLIGGYLAPRPWVVPAYPNWRWHRPVVWEATPIVVAQPQPVIVQQQIPVQQPVFVNQAQVQPQQPVFLNQAPAQAQAQLPEVKPGETLTYEVKPDGTKVYKVTRQEVAAPQQDAARVREN